MKPLNLLKNKKQHKKRLTNETGSIGEKLLSKKMKWIARPKGLQLKAILQILKKDGTTIKGSSFDAISHPNIDKLNFNSLENLRSIISEAIFIEIKTSNQDRVKEDFTGFFFAITENEIQASKKLGVRHQVVLYNLKTKSHLFTSVPELLKRAKSKSWQVSVQL